MSYFKRNTRAGLGDGPITSPSQLPDYFDDTSTQVVGEIGPKRVACEDLPADSPWRGPKGPCPAAGPSLLERIRSWIDSTAITAPDPVQAPTAVPVPTESMVPKLALLAVAGGAAYYLYTKKRRS